LLFNIFISVEEQIKQQDLEALKAVNSAVRHLSENEAVFKAIGMTDFNERDNRGCAERSNPLRDQFNWHQRISKRQLNHTFLTA
jgi:hypothetical protein